MNTTEYEYEMSAPDFARSIANLICGKSHGLWIGGDDEGTIEISGRLPMTLRKGLKTVRMWNETHPRSGVLWDQQFAVWHLHESCFHGGRKVGIPDLNTYIELLYKYRDFFAKGGV